MNFANGDLVVLKSGGPTMTVEDSNRDGTNDVRVVWFSKSNVLRYENFKPFLLRKIEHSLKVETTGAIPITTASGAHRPVAEGCWVCGETDPTKRNGRCNGRPGAAAGLGHDWCRLTRWPWNPSVP